jgi:hypothetical protein
MNLVMIHNVTDGFTYSVTTHTPIRATSVDVARMAYMRAKAEAGHTGNMFNFAGLHCVVAREEDDPIFIDAEEVFATATMVD